MATPSISNRSMSEAMRLSIAQQTRSLNELKSEMTTGRVFDPGLSLGHQAGESVSLRHATSMLEGQQTTTRLATSRIALAQVGLKTVLDGAREFQSALLALRGGGGGRAELAGEAKIRLDDLVARLNQTFDGDYLFAGIDTGTAPMAAYHGTPVPAPQQAVLNAFGTAFPGGPGGAAAQAADGATMTAFIDGAYTSLFDDAGWKANWSSASDTAPIVRVTQDLSVATSVSANSQAVRDLVAAYAMVATFDLGFLSETASGAVLDGAIARLGAGIAGVTAHVADLGRSEAMAKAAGKETDLRLAITEQRIADLEGVDEFETAARLNTVQTQLEAAYQITARLRSLSLLAFLR
ncbi:flagellar hook-associated family protein [Mongoliimonas terrestris]|uniref:flagellar hook-associated family protein n=1 Tax=Mongoliimonas terrestris TaxID=1709001 RepID=UPI0009494F50|nr:flagellar hook-associated family protein [Mongoliimonas terrestris]